LEDSRLEDAKCFEEQRSIMIKELDRKAKLLAMFESKVKAVAGSTTQS
jgi:hypothetical protein